MTTTTRLLSACALLLFSGAASAGDVLVYTGEGALNQGYTNFGVATGKTINYQNVLPANLAVFDCVVLPVNGTSSPAFDPATLTALTAYVNGGGRLIAEAEWDGFAGAILAMNGLASSLGSNLSIVPDIIDGGFHTTFNLHPSTFTMGLNSLRYAATSQVAVAVGPGAFSLAGTATTDTTFIGVDEIGGGLFFLLGDSNVLSDNSNDGYFAHDNGLLAANMCDQAEIYIEVAIDIKFCSDPNAFNCKKKGALPVTIFGTDTFDVTDIDIDSLRLCLADGSACTASGPKDWSMDDRGDPTSDLGASMCALDPITGLELDTLNPDGYDDLDAAFYATEVQDMLFDFCGMDKGAVSGALMITGFTNAGIPIRSVPFPNVGIDQLLKVNK